MSIKLCTLGTLTVVFIFRHFKTFSMGDHAISDRPCTHGVRLTVLGSPPETATVEVVAPVISCLAFSYAPTLVLGELDHYVVTALVT